jgi:hypothetical protein
MRPVLTVFLVARARAELVVRRLSLYRQMGHKARLLAAGRNVTFPTDAKLLNRAREKLVQSVAKPIARHAFHVKPTTPSRPAGGAAREP